MKVKALFKYYSHSLLAKVVLTTTLLIIVILGGLTFIYVQLESDNLRETLIQNKKDFTELLSINLGTAQEIGGIAFQSRLVEESGKKKDTIYVRFVKPTGEIYLSSVPEERGSFVKENLLPVRDTVVVDDVYEKKNIKTIVAPSSGGYTVWLGFSLDSIQATIRTIILSRIFLSLSILVLGLGMSYFLAVRATGDIRELKKVAGEIGRGNLNARAKIKSKDDIGDLGFQFNNMAKSLKESCEKVHQYSKHLKQAKTNVEKEKAKLEAFLTGLGEGVIATDLKGRVMMLNKQAEVMFGHSLNECLGKPYMDLFDFRNNKGEKVLLNNFPVADVISKKKTIYTHGHFMRRGHEPFPISAAVSPILFGQKLIGIVSTFRDITKEERADKAKTEFVSLASHQLQTPLTAVKWFLEMLLKKEKLSKKQSDYIRRAFESNERMISLVEDFLNVSRLEDGTISAYPKKGDFVKWIQPLIAKAQITAKTKHQKIVFESSKKSFPGSFDSNLLSQVISNLLSNAIHYSASGKTTTVSLNKKGKNVEIKIADKGMGISKEDQKRLFSKFFRTRRSLRIDTTGSGLGLYIIKKILDICHGKIQCVSQEGRGSTFIVLIPIEGLAVKGKKKST